MLSLVESAMNRVPFYGTSSPKVISRTFDHLSSVIKEENYESAENREISRVGFIRNGETPIFK